MNTTIQLLEKAQKIKPIPEWTRELKLSRNTLHTAKLRGHISPAIAGAIAEKLGEPVMEWMAVAALESEKDSACKDQMLKVLSNWLKTSGMSVPKS